MKKATAVILILLGSMMVSCKKKSLNCDKECTYDEELLLNFGFEDVTLVQDGQNAYITGIDSGYTSNNNWDVWLTGNETGNLNFLYEGGDETDRIAELVADPLDASNQVLHYRITNPNVNKGKNDEKARTQMQFHQTSCVKEFYQRIDIMFPTSMSYLKDYSETIYWLSLFEFWNNGNWTGEKYPFRVTAGLWKDNGAGNDLYFHVKADRDKSVGGFEDLWDEVNYDYAVPFDEWLTLEVYIKEGDESNGRFYMSVTPNGGSKIELFDITNTTQHPKEKCPDGFTHIQPLKWYTSSEVVNHMKDGGHALEIYWDNWEVWRNKAP